MERNVSLALVMSIIVGVVLVLLGTSFGYSTLVPIGAAVLSGSIIGIVVSYSQASIAADISENVRIRNEHLEKFKEVFSSTPTNNPEGLVQFYSDQKNRFDDRKLLIDDTLNHWESFYAKFQDLKIKLETLKKYQTTLLEKREGWIKSFAENSIKSFVKLIFTDEAVINEFFQTAVELKDVKLDSFSYDNKNFTSSLILLQNILSRTIDEVIRIGQKEPVKIQEEFNHKISKNLIQESELLKTFVRTNSSSGNTPFAVEFWNCLLAMCKDIFGKIPPYRRYRSILSSIAELNSPPSNYLEHLVDDFPTMVVNFIGHNQELLQLISLISVVESQKMDIKNELAKQLSMIRTCHSLPGKCTSLKRNY